MEIYKRTKNFVKFLGNILFPVYIDPETIVQVWVVTEYLTICKIQVLSTTWREFQFKKIYRERALYGIGNPLVVVAKRLNNKTIFSGMTNKEFNFLFGNIATVNGRELVELRNQLGDYLVDSIEELKAIHKRIKK